MVALNHFIKLFFPVIYELRGTLVRSFFSGKKQYYQNSQQRNASGTSYFIADIAEA